MRARGIAVFMLIASMTAGEIVTSGWGADGCVLAASQNRSVITMEAEEITRSGGLLSIDDAHIYENMKTSWSDGYEPVVKEGYADIVLPLSVREDAEIPSVSAALEFDNAKDSPFVIRNYKKTVRAETVASQDGANEKLFFVRFHLQLSENRVNGTYPLTVSAAYSCEGQTITQKFLIYVRITDGKAAASSESSQTNTVSSEGTPSSDLTAGGESAASDQEGAGEGTASYNEASGESAVSYDESSGTNTAEQTATSEPKVILAKCSASEASLQAGGSLHVTATLKNTNKKKYVQNMTVTVTVDEPGITLESESNVFYIEKLGAGKTTDLPLSFSVSDQTLAGKYPVSLELSYDNPDATPLTSSLQFYLKVDQTMNVAFEVGSYATEMNAGDSISIPVQAINMGRDMIYNVRCELNVPGLEARTTLYLGNLDGGTASEGELNAFAGMVNPLAEYDTGRYGATAGTMELVYEDAEGNEYRQSAEIRMTIQPLEINTSQDTEDEDTPHIGRQLLIGAIIIGAAVVILLSLPRRLRRKKRDVYDEE